jgi:hypothetical protein
VPLPTTVCGPAPCPGLQKKEQGQLHCELRARVCKLVQVRTSLAIIKVTSQSGSATPIATPLCFSMRRTYLCTPLLPPCTLRHGRQSLSPSITAGFAAFNRPSVSVPNLLRSNSPTGAAGTSTDSSAGAGLASKNASISVCVLPAARASSGVLNSTDEAAPIGRYGQAAAIYVPFASARQESAKDPSFR